MPAAENPSNTAVTAWTPATADDATVTALARELSLPFPVARILAVRGIGDPVSARRFLNPSFDDLYDPSLLYGMDLAVDRIVSALRRGEKILIYGDYDVDGICAVAILLQGLRALGGNVGYYIPHRVQEGYGLHIEALNNARADGVSLVITVDNGVSAVEAAGHAAAAGLDLIITDHHQLGVELPAAVAVIHPRHPRGSYPFPDLCGAAVALKVLQAVSYASGQPDLVSGFLDLAALATVADVVPLLGENRILVALGLQQMRQNPRPGIAALGEAAGLDVTSLDAGQLAFQLSPRLNSAGRLATADIALQVITATSMPVARRCAAVLEATNRRRQRLQESILMEARDRLGPDMPAVIVLSDPGWHVGVIGIVAARLVEETSRPVLLACERDGVAHGSARSVPGFPMTDALAACSDLLLSYGGHDQAAGFKLPVNNLPALEERLTQIFHSHRRPAEAPIIHYDAQLSCEEITPELMKWLQQLEPFGEGNPEPRFLLPGVPVRSARLVGQDGRHLRLQLPSGLEAIGFGLGGMAAAIRVPGRLDLLGCPRHSEWQGRIRLELKIEALRPSYLTVVSTSLREALAAVYRKLRLLPRVSGLNRIDLETAVASLAAHTGFSRHGIQKALQIFDELNLIKINSGNVILRQQVTKVDLHASPTFRSLLHNGQTGLDGPTGVQLK